VKLTDIVLKKIYKYSIIPTLLMIISKKFEMINTGKMQLIKEKNFNLGKQLTKIICKGLELERVLDAYWKQQGYIKVKSVSYEWVKK